MQRFCSIVAELSVSDGGLYTCQVRSPSGQAAWSASLAVTRKAAKKKFTPPSLFDFPGSPSKPERVSATSSSVTVRWEKPIRIGASPLEGYQVSSG